MFGFPQGLGLAKCEFHIENQLSYAVSKNYSSNQTILNLKCWILARISSRTMCLLFCTTVSEAIHSGELVTYLDYESILPTHYCLQSCIILIICLQWIFNSTSIFMLSITPIATRPINFNRKEVNIFLSLSTEINGT